MWGGATQKGVRANAAAWLAVIVLGAVAASLANFSTMVTSLSPSPEFVPVTTISRDGLVLAGAPKIARLEVTPGATVNITRALVGVGIRRDGALILVDDQVTGFIEGTHTSNREVGNDAVLLPVYSLGDRLQCADVVTQQGKMLVECLLRNG